MNSEPVILTTNSPDETLAVGRRIGAALTGGDVVALVGPLGAGKTHLVKGIAAGAGVADPRKVNSPTFVLVNEYEARLHLYHVDVYRLAGADELDALGFDEMCASDGAVLVEWADRVPECLPADHLSVTLNVTGPDQRELTCTPTGPRGTTLAAHAAAERK